MTSNTRRITAVLLGAAAMASMVAVGPASAQDRSYHHGAHHRYVSHHRVHRHYAYTSGYGAGEAAAGVAAGVIGGIAGAAAAGSYDCAYGYPSAAYPGAYCPPYGYYGAGYESGYGYPSDVSYDYGYGYPDYGYDYGYGGPFIGIGYGGDFDGRRRHHGFRHGFRGSDFANSGWNQARVANAGAWRQRAAGFGTPGVGMGANRFGAAGFGGNAGMNRANFVGAN